MAITARNKLDATQAAQAWAQRVGASGAKWLGGVKSPRRMPNADPDKNVANWQAGVASAAPSMKRGITDPQYLTRLENGAQAKQASYSGAGAAHQQDMANGLNKVFPVLQTLVANLPPRGPKGTNNGRSSAIADGLHAAAQGGALKGR